MINTVNLLYTVSALSSVCCIAVIISIFGNSELRYKSSTQIAMHIAICDFFTCCSAFVGLPPDGSARCWYQAIMSNMFPLSAIFWTTVMAYLIYKIVATTKEFEYSKKRILVICYGVPMILTFLPLTTNTFGTLGGTDGWCFIDKRSNTPDWSTQFWVIFSFYFWLWSALLLYALLFAYVGFYASKRAQDIEDVIKKSCQKMIWYPIIIAACWMFTTIFDIIESFDDELAFVNGRNSINADLAIPLFQGIFKAIAFFYFNPEAWTSLPFVAAVTRAQRENATNNPLLPSEPRTSNTNLGAFADFSRPTLFHHDDILADDILDDDVFKRAKSSIVLSNVRDISEDKSGGSDWNLTA